MTALFIVLFFLNGQPLVDGAVFKTQEECFEQVKLVHDLVVEYNYSAENPIKITHYVAGCAPLNKAPQGKKV